MCWKVMRNFIIDQVLINYPYLPMKNWCSEGKKSFLPASIMGKWKINKRAAISRRFSSVKNHTPIWISFATVGPVNISEGPNDFAFSLKSRLRSPGSLLRAASDINNGEKGTKRTRRYQGETEKANVTKEVKNSDARCKNRVRNAKEEDAPYPIL